MKENAFQKRKLNAAEDGKSIKIEEVEAVDFNESEEDDEESEDESSVLYHKSEYGSLLPKIYYAISPTIDEKSYDAIINIKADGFCGSRTIAYRVSDDQDLFMNVKFAMRDHLITVQEKYRALFSLFDELGRDHHLWYFKAGRRRNDWN
ncbi:hypothetical protein [Parasitella parasitica]|uniref:Uncharacterized protein n=1 Tax=Parasitella parasitica TaxID=35722 RepID=A0A0B7NMW3_9FUNG|nr:hypothetical protein [Parasitella parasitica]